MKRQIINYVIDNKLFLLLGYKMEQNYNKAVLYHVYMVL